MLIRYLILLMLPLCFLACKKSGNITPAESGVDSLHVQYLLSPVNLSFSGTTVFPPAGPAKTYFTYISGKVARRDGGFIPVPVSTGWSYLYTLDVFDQVEYFKDSIVMRKADSRPDLAVDEEKRKLFLTKGRLTTRIYYDPRGSEWNDTMKLSYGANGKVSKTESYGRSSFVVKTFSYDAKGNLLKVLGSVYLRHTGEQYGSSTEIFEGYDGSDNPLKNLWQWDDTFYRSLSENNFTKYTSESLIGGSTGRTSRSWTLHYDSKGRIQLGL